MTAVAARVLLANMLRSLTPFERKKDFLSVIPLRPAN